MDEFEKLRSDLEDEHLIDEEEEPTTRYEEAQRELVVQALDFNLSTLADMVAKETIDTNPRYQRRLRWTKQRQSRLIESFLMNVPVPPIFLAEVEYGKYSVIDGQQRLRAIHGYFHGEYPLTGLSVFSDLNGHTIDRLPHDIRNILTVRPSLRSIIILKQSSPEIKFDVFIRLNTGGVSLNPQEIRNSAYRGSLNDLILDLSENTLLRRMLKVKNPAKSAIVQHMRDCELVLRFTALCDTWEKFSGSMKKTLNRYMEKNRAAKPEMIAELRDRFLSTLANVDAAFGDKAFLRWDPRKGQWGKTARAALFDAEMLASVGLDGTRIRSKRNAIIKKLQKAFESEDFQDAVEVGTNQPSKLKLRVQQIKDILDGVG